MAIRKFRSIEEMDGYRWYEPGDPVLFRAIRRVWELGYRTIRPRFPAGVPQAPNARLQERPPGILGRRELLCLPAKAARGASGASTSDAKDASPASGPPAREAFP